MLSSQPSLNLAARVLKMEEKIEAPTISRKVLMHKGKRNRQVQLHNINLEEALTAQWLLLPYFCFEGGLEAMGFCGLSFVSFHD